MTFSANPKLRKTILWVSALTGLLILIFTLWAPFGLRRMVWQDSWVYSEWLQSGNPMFFPNSRPLNFLAWVIALPLTPNSFLGLHALMIALFMLKGALVYGIVRRLLPENPSIAFVSMILAVIYPADTGFYNDGFLNLHVGFVSYLAALYALLLYWQRTSWWKLALMWIFLALSVFTYEAVHAMVAATPLLLLWYEKRFSKRLIVTAGLWYLPEVAYGAYLVMVYFWGAGLQTREAGLLASGLSGSNPVNDVIQALLFNLRRHFANSWVDAVRLSPFQLTSPLFQVAVLASVVLAGVLWLILRLQVFNPLPVRRYLTLLIIGVIATELGYFMMSLASVRYDGWRTAFYTVLGASLVVAISGYLISVCVRRVRWLVLFGCIALAVLCLVKGQNLLAVLAGILGIASLMSWRTGYSVLMSIIFLVVTVRNLDLQRWVTDIQLFEQDILGTILESAPEVNQGAAILLLVRPENPFVLEHLNNSVTFEGALRILYDDPELNARICQLMTESWGWYSETCQFTESGVHLTMDNTETMYTYDKVILFEFTTDWHASLLEQLPTDVFNGDNAYDPHELIDSGAALPQRYYTMFNPRPLIGR